MESNGGVGNDHSGSFHVPSGRSEKYTRLMSVVFSLRRFSPCLRLLSFARHLLAGGRSTISKEGWPSSLEQCSSHSSETSPRSTSWSVQRSSRGSTTNEFQEEKATCPIGTSAKTSELSLSGWRSPEETSPSPCCSSTDRPTWTESWDWTWTALDSQPHCRTFSAPSWNSLSDPFPIKRLAAARR